jgi:hypothetical protein
MARTSSSPIAATISQYARDTGLYRRYRAVATKAWERRTSPFEGGAGRRRNAVRSEAQVQAIQHLFEHAQVRDPAGRRCPVPRPSRTTAPAHAVINARRKVPMVTLCSRQHLTIVILQWWLPLLSVHRDRILVWHSRFSLLLLAMASPSSTWRPFWCMGMYKYYGKGARLAGRESRLLFFWSSLRSHINLLRIRCFRCYCLVILHEAGSALIASGRSFWVKGPACQWLLTCTTQFGSRWCGLQANLLTSSMTSWWCNLRQGNKKKKTSRKRHGLCGLDKSWAGDFVAWSVECFG